jgi:hypothetical protein
MSSKEPARPERTQSAPAGRRYELSAAQFETISRASSKLCAVALIVTGEGFETFSTLNEFYQHEILCIVSDLASEIEKAVKGEVCHG